MKLKISCRNNYLSLFLFYLLHILPCIVSFYYSLLLLYIISFYRKAILRNLVTTLLYPISIAKLHSNSQTDNDIDNYRYSPSEENHWTYMIRLVNSLESFQTTNTLNVLSCWLYGCERKAVGKTIKRVRNCVLQSSIKRIKYNIV